MLVWKFSVCRDYYILFSNFMESRRDTELRRDLTYITGIMNGDIEIDSQDCFRIIEMIIDYHDN